MTRDEFLAEIDDAGRLLAGLRAAAPSDPLLGQTAQLLAALRADVVTRWPLAAPGAVSIGRFAVRAFDDDSFPELVKRLVRIDALAKGGCGARS